MEIQIDIEPDHIIVLSDEGFNNDNFISMSLEQYGDKKLNNWITTDIAIDDLISALEAFRKKRELNYTRDKLME